jgi:C-terminal processing protease CtpA/Prc
MVLNNKNMKRRLINATLGIMSFFLIYSCKKDNVDPVPAVPVETVKTNEWIYENMNQVYYWNDQMPAGIDHTRESDPEKYFYKLLYEKDKWSSINSDFQKLESELTGEPVSMGYYPQFFMIGQNRIVIAVGYVYPGSPASDAGLKRGDIILSINNTNLDTTNYYTLYSGTNYSVQLGALNGNSLQSTGQSLQMTARKISTDPSIYRKVFDAGGKKIGYLVYTEFISGDNNVFLQL